MKKEFQLAEECFCLAQGTIKGFRGRNLDALGLNLWMYVGGMLPGLEGFKLLCQHINLSLEPFQDLRLGGMMGLWICIHLNWVGVVHGHSCDTDLALRSVCG